MGILGFPWTPIAQTTSKTQQKRFSLLGKLNKVLGQNQHDGQQRETERPEPLPKLPPGGKYLPEAHKASVQSPVVSLS